jgi:hypothetical protein
LYSGRLKDIRTEKKSAEEILRNHHYSRRDTKHNQELLETVQSLKQLYPGVRGTLQKLCGVADNNKLFVFIYKCKVASFFF